MKKYIIKIAIVFILFLIAFFIYALSLLKPVDTNLVEKKRFVIPKGQAISIIAQRLKEENLIKNVYAFRYIIAKEKLAKNIQAGSFDLSSSMSTLEVAKHLTVGTEDVWITILEGWRAEEIAESLSAHDLDVFDPEDFLVLAKASEGRLYPDTYLVPREISSEQIYNLLLSTFERKVDQGLRDEIESSDKDFDQVLVMASLVEREAKTYDQMRRVAGILWNRLDIGMALQVDATLQYANGYNKTTQTWWAVPTSDDKQLESPFNTYLNPGLPPKPISNPGLNAIKASLNPLDSDDLYYIHSSDGNMYYSSSYEDHTKNINRYLR